MGDARFQEPYRRIREAEDRLMELVALDDDEVVQALAHASRERDPMLANVLATEALNRMRRARTAFNHIGEGLVAIDLEGRISSVNPRASELLGASREDLLGHLFEDAVQPRSDDGARLPSGTSAAMRALRTGKVIETEAELLTRRDGTTMPAAVIAAPIVEDGGIHGAVATFLDITARRAAEARWASVVEAALDAIVTVDEAGVVRGLNAAAERIFGYGRADAIGRRLAELLLPPELRGGDLGGLGRVAAGDATQTGGAGGKRSEVLALRADGGRVPVEMIVTRLPGAPPRFTVFARDLTLEHAARAEARSASDRYAQLVGRSPLSTQIFTPDGKTVSTNAAWERLWGVTLDQLGGYDLLADPQLEKKGITPYLRRALAGETVYMPPVRYEPAEENFPLGRARWVEAHAYPLFDAQGKVEAVVLVHDDITERVESGQRSALTHSQAQLLLEHIDDIAICMLDADGRVASWNPGSARLNGYDADEILGQHLRVFYPAEAQARGDAEKALELARAEGRANEEAWLVRKDGSRYWASTTLTAIRPEATVVGFAKVVRDLTQRRAVEERLREQERMYRDLVENSPEPMGVHAGGKLLFINRSGARLLGASAPEEIIGRSVIDFVHPDSRPLVLERVKRMMASPEALPPAEERLLRVDGTAIDVETVALPIRYDGKPAVQLILRDISHRKDAEATLRRFNQDLEARVEERTRALQEAVRDLQTFTNSASHDLRAPLRGTTALATELEEALARGDLEEARTLARLVKRENEKASRLVHDLLAFAKSGQQDVEPTWIDVTALARDVVDDLVRRHPERRTRWEVPDGMRAHADPALLRIALHNLLANAAKYSASVPEPVVRVDARAEDGGTAIVVADNGIGFAPEEARRLFAPFQRLSTAVGYEGTGLGLVTVHRIAARHGGRLRAEGAVGRGATFRLWLPG